MFKSPTIPSIKMLVFTLAACLFFSSFTLIASAEKQEWLDKDYSLKQVERVFIFDPSLEPKLVNGINEHEVLEIFRAKAKLPKHIKVITFEQLVENIKHDTGIDVLDLYQKNSLEGLKLINDGLSRYADLVIQSRIFEYSVGREYREGFTYSTTQYQTAYVNGATGPAVVSMPVNVQHSVPGGNVPTAYASVRWEVTDAKTGKAVMIRIDDRAKANSDIFSNTKPKDLYGRITRSFFDFVSDSLKESKTLTGS